MLEDLFQQSSNALHVSSPSAALGKFSVDEHCDEGRLPWNHFGADVWETERG